MHENVIVIQTKCCVYIYIYIAEEIFLLTNEILPRGFKLRRKLFMKKGKMPCFIKEVLSEQSSASNWIEDQSLIYQSRARISRAKQIFK